MRPSLFPLEQAIGHASSGTNPANCVAIDFISSTSLHEYPMNITTHDGGLKRTEQSSS